MVRFSGFGHIPVNKLIFVITLKVDSSNKSKVLKRNLLQEHIDNKREDSKTPAGGDLALSHWGCTQEGRAENEFTRLYHHLLHEELKSHDNPEGGVVEEGSEDVDLASINNSAVYLVEQVHQDEGVEADGIEDKSIGWLAEVISHWGGDDIETLLEEDERSEIH